MFYIFLIWGGCNNIGTKNELYEPGKTVWCTIPQCSRDTIIFNKWLKNNEKLCAHIQCKVNIDLCLLPEYTTKEDGIPMTMENLEWSNQSFQRRLILSFIRYEDKYVLKILKDNWAWEKNWVDVKIVR